jgi:hypothetical protein
MNLVVFRNIQEVEYVRQLIAKKGYQNGTQLWIGLYRRDFDTRRKRGFYELYDYEDGLGRSSIF